MRSQDVVSSFRRRMAEGYQPVYVVGAGALLCVIQIATAPQLTWSHLLVSFLMAIGIIGISPVPWQWTGDDRLKASPARGLSQSIIVNGIWMGALALLHYTYEPPSPCLPPAHLRIHHTQFFLAQLGLWMFPLLVAFIFGWVWSEKEATEARQKPATELMRQSQARALQSQLEPHVLYNALNSLAGLIQEDPLVAEDVVVQLARLYRMLTERSAVDRIPLSEERGLVEAYLAMEQMRLGERLKVEWHWAPGGDDVRIPPLLLQPLVENAIKHGVSPAEDGGTVRITYDQQGPVHALEVANTGMPPAEGAPKGVGLGNLEARLALWSDANATLRFTHQGDWTLATVRWESRGME